MKLIRRSAGVFAVAAAAFMTTALVGCGSMKSLPSDTFYRLKIESGRASMSNGRHWTERAIHVSRFRGSGVYSDRAIAFSDRDHVVVKQRRYDLWVDSPERMLQNELVSYLRASSVGPVISGSNVPSDGFEIRARILQMDQVVDGDSVSVAVALAFELIAQESGKSLVMGREYRESRAVSGSDMRATASAMSEAVATIFEHFVADAGDALRK